MRRSNRMLLRALGLGTAAAAVGPILCERRLRTQRREPAVWSPGPGERVLIKGAEVLDVVGGQVLHRRGILIKDGRIEGVYTERKAAALEADRVVGAGGAYVIPGLINAHCHMLFSSTLAFPPQVIAAMGRQVERNFEECVTHGVTTVRDAGTMPALLRRYMDRVESGELLGPRVYSAGCFINAPGGYPSDYLKLPSLVEGKWGAFVYRVTTAQEARDAVRRNAEWGCNFIKTAFDDRRLFVGQKPIPILEDELLRAVVDEAHARGLKVSAHHRFSAGFKRALDFELDGVEHTSADQVLPDREVEAFAAAGRFIIPTVQVGWALAGCSHGDPHLDHPLVRQALADRLEAVRSVYPGFCEPAVHPSLLKFEEDYRDASFVERRHLMYTLDPKIFTQGLVVGKENVDRLYHAGAVIGCGNDGGIPQVAAGDLGREMLLLSSYTDMKPVDVLRAATINNARILGVEDELGSVEKGKLADLVLLPGNPLENMAHVLHPDAVFKEGRLVYSNHRLFL